MEKKDLNDDPPHYESLNFDGESEELPSAQDDGEDFEFIGDIEVLEVPPAPPFIPDLGPRTLIYDLPSLAYENIYEACIHYVKEHWCYGSRFVRQMTLTEIRNDSAFHYILDSFCEKRESALTCAPYIGQNIDGPENGTPPPPWDIYVQPPAMFKDGKIKLQIPHTAYVRPCDKCVGNGRLRCGSCSGRGNRRCNFCHGSGRRSSGNSCSSCHGRGRRRCYSCSGSGRVKCRKCDGHGHLEWYRMLIVTWTNFFDDFLANLHNLPPKCAKKAEGNKILLEEQLMLTPIVNAPNESINAASHEMLERHREAFQSMRILRQRHILRAVPLTKVFYQWKGKDGEFYVYGQEKKVYFQEYPQKCCCCTCL